MRKDCVASPAVFPAATRIATHEKKRRVGRNDTGRGRDGAAFEARGTPFGSLGLFAFGAIVWILLPAHRVRLIVAFAASAWFAVFVLSIKPTPKGHPFIMR